MAQHQTPAENPQEDLSIMVGREEKHLGSLEVETELDEDSITEHHAAKSKIEELLQEGYLPVFPLSNADEIDHVIDHGLAPNRSLIENVRDLRGTIGRMPTQADKYMLVVVVDPKAAQGLVPRFTRVKDHAFVGSVGITKEIPSDAIMIIDPQTLEVIHAPEHMRQKLEELQLKLSGKVKSLGSAEVAEDVESQGISTTENAKQEIESLLHRGYLPVFPFEAGHLDDVKKHGLNAHESNVVSGQGWRGTLGRSPVKYAAKCYWAVVTNEKDFPALSPFERSPSTVTLNTNVPAQSIVIIDPETHKIVHAPEGAKVEMVKNITTVVGSTREQVKKVA